MTPTSSLDPFDVNPLLLWILIVLWTAFLLGDLWVNAFYDWLFV